MAQTNGQMDNSSNLLSESVRAYNQMLPITHSDDEESFIVVSESISLYEDEDGKPVEEAAAAESAVANTTATTTQAVEVKNEPEVEQKSIPLPPEAIKNGYTSITSSEFSHEDIHHRIQELVEENQSLRATLTENNTQLKSRLNDIQLWHAEVQKVVLENREQFNKLKHEKALLAAELERVKNSRQQQQQQQQPDLEHLMQQLKLKDEQLQEQKLALNSLQKENSQAQNIQVQSIDDLSAETQRLEKQLALLQTDYQDAVKTVQTLTQEVEETKEALRKSTETNAALNTSLNNERSDSQLLQLQLDVCRAKLHELEHQNSASEGTAKELETVRRQLDSATKLNEQLKRENNALAQRDVANQEQLANVQQSLLQWQAKHAEMERNVEVHVMQLDVYKTDFQAEREARTALKTERDQLAEDLENVQRRNRELQDEIEMIRVNQEFVVPPSVPFQSQTNTNRCPICCVRFRTIRMLEEHAETCADFRP